MNLEKNTRKEKPKPAPTNPPGPKFRNWWIPNGYNSKSGAQTGGHPDALRLCVNPRGDKKHFGIKVEEAWLCARYHDEFNQWMRDGMQERYPECDGTAAPIERQREVINECLRVMGAK